MEPDDVAAIAESLVNERTVDIVTIGRRSGRPRTTEIWTTVVDGAVYITGTPAASQADLGHHPRDWLANLLVEPTFTLRLKQRVHVELPARATPVTDRAERERVMTAPASRYYRENSSSFEHLLDHAPMVRVELTGPAAAVGAVISEERASTPADAP